MSLPFRGLRFDLEYNSDFYFSKELRSQWELLRQYQVQRSTVFCVMLFPTFLGLL